MNFHTFLNMTISQAYQHSHKLRTKNKKKKTKRSHERQIPIILDSAVIYQDCHSMDNERRETEKKKWLHKYYVWREKNVIRTRRILSFVSNRSHVVTELYNLFGGNKFVILRVCVALRSAHPLLVVY